MPHASHSFEWLFLVFSTTVSSPITSTAALCIPTLLSITTAYCTVPTYSATSLCDLVPSFLLFPSIISASVPSLLITPQLCPSYPLFICAAFRVLAPSSFSFVLTCCPSELSPYSLALSLLSSLRFLPLPRCLSDIVCLRAHDGVRRSPSRLTQCSLLPASICWSSGPHRPAQRAGWGA